MKTITAAAVIALTSASLIACAGWSTPAMASPAGLGGGSNVGHNTPSHAPAFGRGFALALTTDSIFSGPGALTSDDRWGPHNTVAFGKPTRGWGPFEVNRQPGTYPVDGIPQPIACSCIIAYDPFRQNVNGGVPVKLAKEIALGVGDVIARDSGLVGGGLTSLGMEGQLMRAVWGNNFDPNHQ